MMCGCSVSTQTLQAQSKGEYNGKISDNVT